MKTLIVLHAFSGNCPAQAAEAYGMVVRAGGCDDRTAAIFHDGSVSRERLIAASPSGHLVLFHTNRYDPEVWLAALERLDPASFACILFPGDYAGRELAARLGCRLRGTALLEVETLTKDGDAILCAKRAYANNMVAQYRLTERPFCLSLARGRVEAVAPSFHVDDVRELPVASDGGDETIDAEAANGGGLDGARFVVAAGRGAGDREGVERLAAFSRGVGAEFGVSRPVAMSAWAPLDRMIGVSGSMTRPRVCLALGASGSAAFYAGIEGSDFIAAVNTDEQSAMAKNANVVVVDDCLAVARELGRLAAGDGGADG